jgi:uncharacterized LabA/DUF88 family protein
MRAQQRAGRRSAQRLADRPDFVKSYRGLVAIVLDTAYLGMSAAELGDRPPYAELVTHATAGRAWVGTAVVLARQVTAGINRFTKYLDGLGFLVILSWRREVYGRSKASDDVVIAAEAACAACDPAISEVVLCSGDGDLSHVIDICHRHGKPCSVAAYRHSLSSLLRRADRLIAIDALHLNPAAEAA